MSDTKPNPTIFISYSWKNESVADEIDRYFSSVGKTPILKSWWSNREDTRKVRLTPPS